MVCVTAMSRRCVRCVSAEAGKHSPWSLIVIRLMCHVRESRAGGGAFLLMIYRSFYTKKTSRPAGARSQLWCCVQTTSIWAK